MLEVRQPGWPAVVALCVLSAAWLLAGTTASDASHSVLSSSIAAGYLAVCAAPVVVAVLTEHPRGRVVAWLAVAALCGLLPCAVAAWWVCISGRRRRGPVPAWRIGMATSRPCAPHLVIGCADCGPGAGSDMDYLTLALANVESVLGSLETDGLGLGYPSPVLSERQIDDLDEARYLLRQLAGAGDDAPGGPLIP